MTYTEAIIALVQEIIKQENLPQVSMEEKEQYIRQEYPDQNVTFMLHEEIMQALAEDGIT